MTAARTALAAILGATVATSVVPARYTASEGLAIGVSWRFPAAGSTRIELPPLGEVQASTHEVPVELLLRLERVEPMALATLTRAGSADDYRELQEDLTGFLRRSAWMFGVRQMLLGAVGGAIGVRLATGTGGVMGPLAGALAGGAGMAALAAGVTVRFDAAAFQSPRYRGVLEAAPQIVDLAREGIQAVGHLGRRLQASALRLQTIYRQMDSMREHENAGPEIVVAHVSDLHNNPAGFDLLQAMVEHFGVSVVIDTGDMLDLGSSLEPILTSRIASLGVPYLYVPGNHDTPRLIQTLRALPNVRVLDGEPTEVEGIRVLGTADPGAFDEAPEALDQDAASEFASQFARSVEQAQPAADVIALHHSTVARLLPAGLAQAVLFGHDHRLAVDVRDGTAYVDAGSTGAGGLRGLQGDQLGPFTLTLLRFEQAGDGVRLTAIDAISLDGLSGELSLERRLVGTAQREDLSGVEKGQAEAEPAR